MSQQRSNLAWKKGLAPQEQKGIISAGDPVLEKKVASRNSTGTSEASNEGQELIPGKEARSEETNVKQVLSDRPRDSTLEGDRMLFSIRYDGKQISVSTSHLVLELGKRPSDG